MIVNKRFSAVLTMLAAILLAMTICSGCGRQEAGTEPTEAVPNTETAGPAEAAEVIMEPAAAAEVEVESDAGRQNGERFEDVIILEGMEETVRYEHVRNDAIGFEMDYDYENFVRHSEPDRECFVSCWDNPDNPENYLEVKYSPLVAEAAAAAIGETLSNDYDISRDDSFPLEGAGSCIRIDASADVGGLTMPEQLQAVYIIAADDGCRVATAHYAIEGSEGFGRRFRYIMDTFSAIDRQGEK